MFDNHMKTGCIESNLHFISIQQQHTRSFGKHSPSPNIRRPHLSANFSVLYIALGMLQWIVESRLGDLSQALEEGSKFRDLCVGNGKNRWCLYVEGMRNGDCARRRANWCPNAADQVLDGVRVNIDAHGTWIRGRPSGDGKSTRRRKSPNRERTATTAVWDS
jgi:hypothetical protein